MKLYRITRYDASTVDCRVQENGGPSRQLVHVAAHSPTGFNCGYLGSGPGDLALSILVDFLGEDPEQALLAHQGKSDAPSEAVRLHQQFKFDIIANVFLDDGQSVTLSDEQIGTWLDPSTAI